MPDGSVICIKPKTRTINRILRFNNMGDSFEKALLSSMVPIKIHPSVVNELKKKGDDSFDDNHTYVDGVIQDLSTGEFFYFLAIHEDGSVNIRRIDEGSIVEYDKEYKGIAEINLYKGNTGHSKPRKKMLKDFIEEFKENPENIVSQEVIEEFKEDRDIAPQNVKGRASDSMTSETEPILARREIVRYVEILRTP